jgi:hypothetical protein
MGGHTQFTSDIWNGRWNRHMWNDILVGNAEDPILSYEFTAFRLCMKKLTSKLFETQSALSRQRFKLLVKRLGDPMYERSTGIPDIVKKRLLDQHSNEIVTLTSMK